MFLICDNKSIKIHSMQTIRVFCFDADSFVFLWRFIGYFTYVQQGSVPEHPEGVYDEIQNLDACLQLCYTSTSFVCNSFYYCPNELQCLFSKQHVPNTPAIKSADACQAYSSKYFNTNRQSLDCLYY